MPVNRGKWSSRSRRWAVPVVVICLGLYLLYVNRTTGPWTMALTGWGYLASTEYWQGVFTSFLTTVLAVPFLLVLTPTSRMHFSAR